MTLADLGPTVLGFFGVETTFTRDQGSGAYDSDGLWEPDLGGDVTIRAHIHPLTKKEAERLPENVRTRATLQVNTLQQVFATSEDTDTQGDTFHWRGDEYEIIHTSDWTTGGHYEAVAAKVGA